MHLSRFSIGVQFNKRSFRLASMIGVVIEDVIRFAEKSSDFGPGFFTQVSQTADIAGQQGHLLSNPSNSNSLLIRSDQMLLKITSEKSGAAVNVDDAINKYKYLWKAANKSLDILEIRRIGFVGEYRMAKKEEYSGSQLLKQLTKLPCDSICERFHLNFENKEILKQKGGSSVDDFWNYIYSYYTSEMDETPEKGKINANIDVQRYYNPAKIDPIAELPILKKKYLEKKNSFKEGFRQLGLSE